MTSPDCRLGGSCDLVSRADWASNPAVVQCRRCSAVYEPTALAPRRCGHCAKGYGESLHDPCLGTIPGASEACCGHGDESAAFIRFADRVVAGAEVGQWARI